MSKKVKKGRQVFQEKNRGVTPSVAAQGVTHPSDATVRKIVLFAQCSKRYVLLVYMSFTLTLGERS